MQCFLWGQRDWEPDPAHHYPCSRCLILWPSITIQASNETLLVSSSPDIRVLLQRLRYAIIQPLLHAHIGALQPWLLNKHAYTEKISLKREGMKIMSIFLCDIMILSGEKERPPKGEIYHASTWKQCWAFFQNGDHIQRVQSNVALTITDVFLVNWLIKHSQLHQWTRESWSSSYKYLLVE